MVAPCPSKAIARVRIPLDAFKVLFLISLLLLSGCGGTTEDEPITIDISTDINQCIVFYDRVECVMANNNTLKANMLSLKLKTIWDSSAWIENTAYCPIGFNGTNASNCKELIQKYCYADDTWVPC